MEGYLLRVERPRHGGKRWTLNQASAIMRAGTRNEKELLKRIFQNDYNSKVMDRLVRALSAEDETFKGMKKREKKNLIPQSLDPSLERVVFTKKDWDRLFDRRIRSRVKKEKTSV